MDQPPDKRPLFQQKQLMLQKQQEQQHLLKQQQQKQQCQLLVQQSQQQHLQQQSQQQSQQVQPQQTYYQQHQVLEVQPQSQQQQNQLITKQQVLRNNQHGILQQRILQQEHLKQKKQLLDRQQKQEQALRDILELQDNNQDKDEPQADRLLVQAQRPQLIQQQQQLHLQQQQRQQQEQQQQLQILIQKQQQQSQQQTQVVVQQPQIVQQTQIIQSQQPQFVQQTVQTQSQDAQQPLIVQKSQPQIVKKTQLVQQLAQQSQPVQLSQLLQQPQILQQPQNVQQLQQNHQYTVSSKQTKKQPPHSQQLLQQQLQQLLLNNKSLPQRIVVLGSQSQQQQLQQQPPRVVSANTTNQQHLLSQQVQCVVVTGTGQQQPQQRVVVTGNGHNQQQMQRIVVASTSQQQPQIQRVVVTNAGQQQLQQVVFPSTTQHQAQQMQSIVTSSSSQQTQQTQRIVVSTVSPQQSPRQIHHVATPPLNQQQQQLSQQSGQRIVIGQMKPLQQTQQVQSPSQCGVVVSQLQPKDIHNSIATKQQQRVVISKQSQLLKLPQQQSPQHMLLTQQLAQKSLQLKQQKSQQHVVAISQQQTQEIDQKLQQKQQISQNVPQSIAINNQQPQQQINVQLSNENLVQEFLVKQSHQQVHQLHRQQSLKQLYSPVQPQQQQKQIEHPTHLENDKQQEVMRNGLSFGQLQHQIRPDPEKLRLQMQLQQLQRQKLQEHLLAQQRQHVEIQQKIKSKELKLLQKHRQQELREQVLLQQHLKQQKQLQIRQQLLLRQQALSKNRISYILGSKQEKNQLNNQEIDNQQTKSTMPELLQLSEKTPAISRSCKSDTKCNIKSSFINTEEQSISLSSSSDDEEDDDTTRNNRYLLIEAERLVRERYNALSEALGPKYKGYYDEILGNWLQGRLSRAEFDRDIRKVMYVSWIVSMASKDGNSNSDDAKKLEQPASATSKTSLATSSLKQEFKSTRSKSKQLASSLSKNITAKNKVTETNKKNEAVFILEKRLPLHNAFIASLVEWIPLNSQRLDRRAARIRGLTETGRPIRLYTYADIPSARGPISHWCYEEPGSLTRWYWPDCLPCNSPMTSTIDAKSSNRSFLAQERKIAADTAIAAVSLRPPSRCLLPLLLRSAENKKALCSAQRKMCLNMRLKKLMLKSKKRLPKQWLKGKRHLALMVRMREGHTQLLRVLKARNLELGDHERGLIERLNRLKTRVSLRRRKVLALFKIRQQELKTRVHKYINGSWQNLPEDQPQEELLNEAAIDIDDEDTDDDNEDDDDEEEEGQYASLKKHLDRIRLMAAEKEKQKRQLKVINSDTFQNQSSRGRRTPLAASTILLLRDRQKIRECRRLLHTVKTDRLQVSRDVGRVLELRHKICPCGESDGRPCRYKSQMRRLLHKIPPVHKLDEIGDQVQRTLAEEVSEKEKLTFEEGEKPTKDTIIEEVVKVEKEKVEAKTTLVKNKKINKTKKKKAPRIGNKKLNKKSENLNKTVTSNFIKKTKTLKNANQNKSKRSSVDTKATSTETMASPLLNDNKPVKTIEKHDIGISCELLQDENSPLTLLYSPAFQQTSLATLDRRSTLDVSAAAARAVKAALAASRRTEDQDMATVDESTNSIVEEYADRQASELMPPPPPPPPPPTSSSTKTSTTSKSPSVGARYLQQQQLLLDRHRQLERMRREESRKRARLARQRIDQDYADNFDGENNESPNREMETDDLYFEYMQNNMNNRRSLDTDLGTEELDDYTPYEGSQIPNNYFSFDDYYSYSSDEEMSGSSFPPLLHDLRIDQLPRPSNRIPAAALLPPGVRTRLSTVPLIFPNNGDFELSANNEEHETEMNQNPVESNPQEHSVQSPKEENDDPSIKHSANKKEPSQRLSQNIFLTARTSMATEGVTEPVTSSINKKSPVIEKRTSKRLQSNVLEEQEQKQQLSDDKLTVNKIHGTFEQHKKKAKHEENNLSVVKMTSTTLLSSPVERRSRRVLTKLSKIDEKLNTITHKQKTDEKPKQEIVKRKRDLDHVELSLAENNWSSKQETKHSNSKQDDKNKSNPKYSEKKDSPPLKKIHIDVGLAHKNKTMEPTLDVSHLQPKKKNVTFAPEHLTFPTKENVKNSNSNHNQCNTVKKKRKIDTLPADEKKFNRDKDCNDSGSIKKSARPLVQQKRRLGRHGRERVKRDKIQYQQQSVQKLSQTKRQKSQPLNEQNTTNVQQKQFHQNKRLERIKFLEKKKVLLEQQKIKLDQKNSLLEKRSDGKSTVEQQRSKCIWTLVEFPVSSKSYYNERLSLREQLLRKIFKDKNVQQPTEVKQTQSKNTIGTVTKNSMDPKNENKLEIIKTNYRGSGYWWTKIGMQRKTSPLLLRVNKSVKKKSKSKVNVPLTRQVQRTKPQIKKTTTATVVENHKKTSLAGGLTLDEKNKLQQILKPQILKMVTEAEGKWLEQLQLQSVQLDQQVNKHFKAMTEKQQQQVKLLLKKGKRLKKKYQWKYKLKTKIIVTRPKRSVSKRWKQLDILRLQHQNQWKAYLSQLLEAKMINKLFFRELYDRLIRLTSSDQHKRQPNILSALKQLQHKPLNANERYKLQKLMEQSKQKFISQSLPKQINKPKVITHQNKSLQKPSLQKHPLEEVRLQLTQKQTKLQNNSSKKSINQKCPLKPKLVGDKRKHNKEPQVKQNQQLEKQLLRKKRTTQKQVNHGRTRARKRSKPSLAIKLRSLFQLRNRLIDVESRVKKSQRQRPISITEIAGTQSEQQKSYKSAKWVLRKMTFLMYTQRIVLQRQLDRLDEWYPNTINKRQDSLVLLTSQEMTTLQKQKFVVPIKSLEPLSSEQVEKVGSQQELQRKAEEKRQILKQQLSGVQSQLKPLMKLWLLYLRFPERWLHQQFFSIKKLTQKMSFINGTENTSSENECLQKPLQCSNEEPLITTTDNKSKQLYQQIKRIREHLDWRQQRVCELIIELSMAMRQKEHVILSTSASTRSPIYPVSLRLGKSSTSKQVYTKYSALLRLQKSSSLKRQQLSYALLLKLQRSCVSKNISSNYTALLKLHKSSIRSALSTPQEQSRSKHQFSVSLTPLQPFGSNQKPSNMSAILRSLAQSYLKQQLSSSTSSSSFVSSKQQNRNKSNNNEIFRSENCGDQNKSVSTKKSNMPISAKRSRCLKSVTRKTKKSVNTINVKKQTPTIIISDSSDETETIKISSDECTDLINPIFTKINAHEASKINCTSTVIILDSDEDVEAFDRQQLSKVGSHSQMSKKSKLNDNLIGAKHFTAKKGNIISEDNDFNCINILDSDEETDAPSFELSPKIKEPVQMLQKSNLTTNFTNIRTLLPKSATKLRDLENNDDISTVIELSKYKQKNCLKKTVPGAYQHSVSNPEISVPAVNTNIRCNSTGIEVTLCKPKETNKQKQTNNNKPIKVAIVENIRTSMATSKKPLNLASQSYKPLKMVASLNDNTRTVDMNFMIDFIKKLTETAISVARKNHGLIGNRKTQNSPKTSHNYSLNFKPTKKKSDVEIHRLHPCDSAMPDQILRRRRRLIRTVTIDTSGPAVPKFCDHGFPDGSIEKVVHSRFVSTIMAMTAANEIVSCVPPQRPRMPIECAKAKRFGYIPTLSDIDDDYSDKSDSNDNKVTTSTNTPVELSDIMDLLEKADRASVETGCSTVHIWSGSARTSGSLLVSAIRSAKERVASLRAQYMSQIKTTTPSVSPPRQSRTTVTKAEDFVLKLLPTVTRPIYQRSVSASTEVTSTNGNNCSRLGAPKRSASVAFMETPASCSVADDQLFKSSSTISDTSGNEQQMLSLRTFKRSADEAFSPELLLSPRNTEKSNTIYVPADSSTKSTPIMPPPVLRKSKRSKSAATTSTSVLETTPPVVKSSKRSKSTSSTTITSTVTPEVVLPHSVVKSAKRTRPISLTSSTSASICSSTSGESGSPPAVKHPKRSKSAVASSNISPESTSPSLVATVVKPSKRSKSLGSNKNPRAKVATATTLATPSVSVTLKNDTTPKIPEDFVAPINSAVDQDKVADVNVNIEHGAVEKTTEITEDETCTVTVTRTRCSTVPAPMDVTSDACSLVVSACEQFVRAMVLERLTKAGRGFGTMELRRRDAFAAAMAFDENIRPTPEYCSTSSLAGNTTEASVCPNIDGKNDWLGFKLLHSPVTSVDDETEQAQRPTPTIVFNNESNTSTVLTVDTVVETQTTTTTTTTITAVNDQYSTMTVYTVKPISSPAVAAESDTSARTRGVVLLKTTVPKMKTAIAKTVVTDGNAPVTQTNDKHSPADTTSRAPDIVDAAAVFPDSTTEVVVNGRTLPITVTDRPADTADEHQTPETDRGFYVERGRPLLRPEFHRRRPFGTLIATSVMAALETTAENDAACKCVVPDEEKVWKQEKEEWSNDEDTERYGGGADESWGCYFGDASCLPPASRLKLFLPDRTRIAKPKTPANAACPRASSYSDDEDDPTPARQRKQLLEEIVRRQRFHERLTREVERRLLEQRDRPRDTEEEHYQKFLRLQYGSKDAVPGPPKTPCRPPSGDRVRRGIVSWY